MPRAGALAEAQRLEDRILLTGDTLAEALATSVGSVHVEEIGDEGSGSSDVDLFAVVVDEGETLLVDVDAERLDDGTWWSSLDAVVRVFDGAGNELTSNDDNVDPQSAEWLHDPALGFVAPSTGTYYVGVSGYGNESYDVTTGSGSSGSTGTYELHLSLYTPSGPEVDSFDVQLGGYESSGTSGQLVGTVLDDGIGDQYTYLEFDYQDDGDPDVDTSGVGVYVGSSFSESVSLPFGNYTIRVRGRQWDSFADSYVNGEWSSITVSNPMPVNDAPLPANGSFMVEDQDTSGAGGYLSVDLTDDEFGDSTELLFDYGDDGTIDYSTWVSGSTSFSEYISGVPYDISSIRVTTRQWDSFSESYVEDDLAFAVSNPLPVNDAPLPANGSFTVEDQDTSGAGGYLSVDLTDDEFGDSTELLFDYGDDGTVDYSTWVSGSTSFSEYVSGVPYDISSIRVTTRQWDSFSESYVEDDLAFAVSNPMPVNDPPEATAFAFQLDGRYESGAAGYLDVVVDDDEVNDSTLLEFDFENDGGVDYSTTVSGSASLSEYVSGVPYGTHQVRVRASQWDSFSGQEISTERFFTLDNSPPAADSPGEVLGEAMSVSLVSGGEVEVAATIGDGSQMGGDVDLFSVVLAAGDVLVADVDARQLDGGGSLSGLDSYVRVFDASGGELASNDDGEDPDTDTWSYDSHLVFVAASAGTYYVGVSGYGNSGYDPNSSGTSSWSSTGDYRLQLGLNDDVGGGGGSELPSLSIDNGVWTDENGGSVSVWVSLDATPTQQITVDFGTVDGSATAGSDYVATSGSLVWAIGDTNSKEIVVPLVGTDGQHELEETFQLVLANAVGATIDQGIATVHVDDADPYPSVSFTQTSATVVEGQPIEFTVALDLPSAEQVEVEWYAYAEGETESEDFVDPGTQTLVFAPGQTVATIAVATVDDGIHEPDESISVYLSSSTNADLGDDAYATGTIQDNDQAPIVSIASMDSVNEGDTGSILVQLTGETEFEATVDWSFKGSDTGDGTATPDDDYYADSGTLVFEIGQTEQWVSFSPISDGIDEDDESLLLFLENETNAVMGDPQAYLEIVDTDDPPTLTIDDDWVSESDGVAILLVELSNESSKTITVDFATQDGSANVVDDYVAESGTLVWEPGESGSKPIAVTIVSPDDELEPTEEFTVLLSNAVNATIDDDTGQVTVEDYESYNNSSPIAAPVELEMLEDGEAVEINLYDYVTDPDLHDQGSLSIDTFYGDPDFGLWGYENGTLEFTPEQDFNGTASASYEVVDQAGLRDTGYVEITVHPVNDAPVAEDDRVVTGRGQEVTVDVLSNDTDVDNDHEDLTIVDVGLAPSHGVVEVSEDGRYLVYSPRKGFLGHDVFTYQVTDGVDEDEDGQPDLVDTATVHVYVGKLAEVDADDDVYNVSHGDVLLVHDTMLLGGSEAPDGIIENDEIFESGLIRVVELEGTRNYDWVATAEGLPAELDDDGEFLLSPTGAVSYAAPDKLGTFTFQYVVSAPELPSWTDALLSVFSLTPVDRLTGIGQSVDQVEDGVSRTQDDDDEGATKHTIDAIVTTGVIATAGPISLLGLPVLVEGEDMNVATVTINVTNELPVAVNDEYTVRHNEPLRVSFADGLLANDTDGDPVDQHRLTVVADTSTVPAGAGTLTVEPSGSLLFLPNADYEGSFTFTYHAYDGFGYSLLPGFVTIDVTNDAPSGQADWYSLDYESGDLLVPHNGGLLVNDTDGDGDVLKVVVDPTTSANGATVVLRESGAFAYTPAAGFSGEDAFTYRVTDGVETSDPITVTVDVQRTWPNLVDDVYQVSHDGSLLVTGGEGVLSNDSNVADSRWQPVVDVGPTNGSLEMHAGGGFAYRPNPGFVGTEVVQYSVSKDGVASGAATLLIEVVNDAPAATDDWYSTTIDTVFTTDADSGLLANDGDAQGDFLVTTLSTGPSHGTVDLRANGVFAYTPGEGFVGQDSFTYLVGDGIVSSTATVYVDVFGTHDPPYGDDLSFSVVHDGALVVPVESGLLENVTPGASDVPSVLTSVIEIGPANGTLALDPKGSFLYRPNPGFVGQDVFTYRALDGSVASSPITVTIEVGNDAPTGEVDAYSVAHGAALLVNRFDGLLGNDEDSDGDELTVVLLAGPANGSIDLRGSGAFLYLPDDGFVGVDEFTYQLTDGLETSGPITVSISVENQAPVLAEEAYTVLHANSDRRLFEGPIGSASAFHPGLDAASSLDLPEWQSLLANHFDPDGDELTVSIDEASVLNGTLSWDETGAFEYLPDPGFVGTETIAYTVSDGFAIVESTFTIDVVNHVPTATDDAYSVVAGETLFRSVWNGLGANDHDSDGDRLTFVLESGPSHGTLVMGVHGSFHYTPDSDFSGVDSFTYRAADPRNGLGAVEQGTSDVAVVTLVVAGHGTDPGVLDTLPPVPVARPDSYEVVHDGTLIVRPGGRTLLRNDTGHVDGPLTITLTEDVKDGALFLAADGSFVYTPEAGFVGTDTFEYVASDGFGTSAATLVTIAVTNALPQVEDEAFEIHTGESLNLRWWNGLLANDGDEDGDSLVVDLDPSQTVGGTLNWADDGSIQYAPDPGFVGTETIDYTVADGHGTPVSGVLTIDVTDVAPVGEDDQYDIQHDHVLVVNGSQGVLANDEDEDGDRLEWTVVSTTAHGTLTTYATGGFAYTPDAGFVGTDSFVYVLDDGALQSAPVTVTIDVSNESPIVEDDSYTVTHEDMLFVGSRDGILANDDDPDGDPLTFVVVQPTTFGTLVVEPNGALRYRPNEGFVGTDTFAYEVTDGTDANDDGLADVLLGVVTIDVTNDEVDAVDDEYTLSHDRELLVGTADGVLVNDQDGDGDFLELALVAGPQNGTLELKSTGAFRYTPDEGFVGTDTFLYTAFDGAFTDLATVTLNVVNHAPDVEDDVFEMTHDDFLVLSLDGEDSLVERIGRTVARLDPDGGSTLLSDTNVLTTTLLANDSDDEGDPLTLLELGWTALVDPNPGDGVEESVETTMAASVGTDPLTIELDEGDLIVTRSGLLAFLPDEGFVGEVSLSYLVGDGLTTSTGAITIDVVNHPPRATHDFFADEYSFYDEKAVATNGFAVGLPGSGAVLDNDSEDDGDPVRAEKIADVGNGTLTFDEDSGAFRYEPDAGFVGVDGFVYRIVDGLEPSLPGAGTDGFATVWSPNETSYRSAFLDADGSFDPLSQFASLLTEWSTEERESLGVVLFHVENLDPVTPSLSLHSLAPLDGETIELVFQSDTAGARSAVGPSDPASVLVDASLSDFVTDPNGDTDLGYTFVDPGITGVSVSALPEAGCFKVTVTFEYTGDSFSFQYVVQDPHGGTSEGTISIEVHDAFTEVGASPEVLFRENEFEVRRLNAEVERSAEIKRARTQQAAQRAVDERQRGVDQFQARMAYESTVETAVAASDEDRIALRGLITGIMAAEQARLEARATEDNAFFTAAVAAERLHWSTTTDQEVTYREVVRAANEANDTAVEAALIDNQITVAAHETAFQVTGLVVGDTFDDAATLALLQFNADEEAAALLLETAIETHSVDLRTDSDAIAATLDSELRNARDQLDSRLSTASQSYESAVASSHAAHAAGLDTARTDRDAAAQSAWTDYQAELAAAKATFLAGMDDSAATSPLDLGSDPAYSASVDQARTDYDQAVAIADADYEVQVGLAESTLEAALESARTTYNTSVAAAKSVYESAVANARTLYRADLQSAFNGHEAALDLSSSFFVSNVQAAQDAYVGGLQSTNTTHGNGILAAEVVLQASTEAARRTRNAGISGNQLAYEQSLHDADVARHDAVVLARTTHDDAVIAARRQLALDTHAADAAHESPLRSAQSTMDGELRTAWEAYDTTVWQQDTQRHAEVAVKRNAYVSAVFTAERALTDARRTAAATAYVEERLAFGVLGSAIMEENATLLVGKIAHDDFEWAEFFNPVYEAAMGVEAPLAEEGMVDDDLYDQMKRDFLVGTANAELDYRVAVADLNLVQADSDQTALAAFGQSSADAQKIFEDGVAVDVHAYMVAVAGAELARANAHADAARDFALAAVSAAHDRAVAMAGHGETFENALADADLALALANTAADSVWDDAAAAARRVRAVADADVVNAHSLEIATVGETFANAISVADETRTLSNLAVGTAFANVLVLETEAFDSAAAAADEQLEYDLADAGLLHADRLLVAIDVFTNDTTLAGHEYVDDVSQAQHAFADAERFESLRWREAELAARTAARNTVATARRDAVANWAVAQGTNYAAYLNQAAEARLLFEQDHAATVTLLEDAAAAAADLFHEQDVLDLEVLSKEIGHAITDSGAASTAAFADYAHDLGELLADFREDTATEARIHRNLLGDASRRLSLELSTAMVALRTAIGQATTQLVAQLGAANTALVGALNDAYADFVALRAAAEEALDNANGDAGRLLADTLAAANRVVRGAYSAADEAHVVAAYAAWKAYQNGLAADAHQESNDVARAQNVYALALAGIQKTDTDNLHTLLDAVEQLKAQAHSRYARTLAAIQGDELVFEGQKGVARAHTESIEYVEPVEPETVWEWLWNHTQTFVIGVTVIIGISAIAAFSPVVAWWAGSAVASYFLFQGAKARYDQGLTGGITVLGIYIPTHALGAAVLDRLLISDAAAVLFDYDLATLKPKEWAEGEKSIATSNAISGLLLAGIGPRIARGTHSFVKSRFKGRLGSGLVKGFRRSRNDAARTRDTAAELRLQSRGFDETLRRPPLRDPNRVYHNDLDAVGRAAGELDHHIVAAKRPYDGDVKQYFRRSRQRSRTVEEAEHVCNPKEPETGCFVGDTLVHLADDDWASSWYVAAAATGAIGATGYVLSRRRKRDELPPGTSVPTDPDLLDEVLDEWYEGGMSDDDDDRGDWWRTGSDRPEWGSDSGSRSVATMTAQPAIVKRSTKNARRSAHGSAPARSRMGTSLPFAILLGLAVVFGLVGVWQDAPRALPIEAVRVGEVLPPTLDPTGGADTQFGTTVDPPNWRKLTLRAPKPAGGHADVRLLRPVWWLELNEATVGGTVDVAVPECGIEGRAEVLAIDPCPEIPHAHRGHVVTGHFVHHVGAVYQLAIEGLDEPIGTTGNHPFWSEDREAYVRADALRPGERLRTRDGTTVVRSVTRRAGPTTVHNLEVQFAHVYHVGTSGVLVHNARDCETVYRSLNDDDIESIYQWMGVKREGRGGAQALADLIVSADKDTKYIPVTESFKVVKTQGDPNNYIAIDTTKLVEGAYISKDTILSSKLMRKKLGAKGLRYVQNQRHGAIVRDIPMEAIIEVVIDGQRWTPNPE